MLSSFSSNAGMLIISNRLFAYALSFFTSSIRSPIGSIRLQRVPHHSMRAFCFVRGIRLLSTFDHADIIRKAREALQSAAITKAAAFSLLDETFTVDELQQLLEVIYGHKYDSEHFRQQILSAGFIEPADGTSDRYTFNPLKHEAFIRQRQRSEDLPFVL